MISLESFIIHTHTASNFVFTHKNVLRIGIRKVSASAQEFCVSTVRSTLETLIDDIVRNMRNDFPKLCTLRFLDLEPSKLMKMMEDSQYNEMWTDLLEILEDADIRVEYDNGVQITV